MVTIAKERVRKRERIISRGEAWFSTGVRISGDKGETNVTTWKCTDWVRPKDDPKCYPLAVYFWNLEGGLLNKGTTGNGSRFTNFIPEVYQTQDNFNHPASFPGEPSVNAVATAAAARTNPSRPYVDVPVFIFELGDIAQILRDSGKSIIKKAASSNLKLQFGLIPLFEDFIKLVQFLQMFSKRMQELDALASKRGLRRTTDHGQFSTSGTLTRTIQSQGVLYNGTYSWNSTREIRAHCRWVPTGDFKKLSRGDLTWLMKRALHGLEFSGSTVWESLPWSWLVDYCTTIGNYFSAHRNIIPAELQDVFVMRHTKTTFYHPGKSDNGWSFAAATVTRESKWRDKGVVTPTAHFPFLSGNQVGILASLVISRLFK